MFVLTAVDELLREMTGSDEFLDEAVGVGLQGTVDGLLRVRNPSAYRSPAAASTEASSASEARPGILLALLAAARRRRHTLRESMR